MLIKFEFQTPNRFQPLLRYKKKYFCCNSQTFGPNFSLSSAIKQKMCLLIEYSIFLITIVSIKGNIINNSVNDDIPSESTIDLSSLGGRLYGIPDAAVGARVSTWTPDDVVNPEELGSYVQGDLLMNRPRPIGKNGLTELSTRWAKNRVPYKIKGNFSTNLGFSFSAPYLIPFKPFQMQPK